MSVPGKKVQNGTYEFDDYMRQPDTRTRWEAIKDGIYNPAEGTYCGNPPRKWAITGAFYACFFSALAVFFTICMKGMLATLYEDRPKWTLDDSLIGSNPGLGFRPLPDDPSQRSLIWYSASNHSQVQEWTDRLDRFLAAYTNSSLLQTEGRNQQICSPTETLRPDKVCAVLRDDWGPCTSENLYGFNSSSPCVFIKLNRIYGWQPDFYNDPKNLPSEMPENLTQFIRQDNVSTRDIIWVSCKGENPHDNESIGEVRYYPESHGFPGYYYPYVNQPGYLSPLVAVHFLRPERNRIINVECRAWAKNIHYSSVKSEKKGAVHFELMVDD